jgi:hypothetical protein
MSAGPAGGVIGRAENRLLPAESTPLLMQYLSSYADGFPNRCAAVAKLLNCSQITAKRLLSKSKPYRGRMRTGRAARICDVVGQPLSSVAPARVTRTCVEAMVGWASAATFSEAMQLATDCALSICVLAFNAFGLRGWFTLRYDAGWPTSVDVSLTQHPELIPLADKFAPHRIVVTMERCADGQRRMFVSRHHKIDGRIDKQPMTYDLVERHITRINALTTHHAAGLEREVRIQTPEPR